MGRHHVIQHPQIIHRVTLAATAAAAAQLSRFQAKERFQVRDLLFQLEVVLLRRHLMVTGLVVDELVCVIPQTRHVRRWWSSCFEIRHGELGRQTAVPLNRRLFWRWWWWSFLLGEVELGFVTADAFGGDVVGSGRFFGWVVSTEPDSDAFLWVSNLGRPFPPWSLPYPSVDVLPSSLSLTLPLGLAQLLTLLVGLCDTQKFKL